MSIATINPATGETVKTFTPATDDEVEAAIARAHDRFLDYRHSTTFAQRAEWANATADLLEKEADHTAAMMTLEMGKTLKSAKAEALKCAKGFRYYAENAEKLLADEPAEAAKVGANQGVHPLPAARGGAGRDAVELPALAGRPVRRAGADGGQRRPPQTRLQRAAVGAVPFRRHRPRRLPGGLLPDAAGVVQRCRGASCATPGSRRPR